jgi:hypothetical protein
MSVTAVAPPRPAGSADPNIGQRYQRALDSLIAKLRQDKYVLAAILCGSLSHDSVWEKSDIDLLLVGRDERIPVRSFCLVEDDINVHAQMYSRSKFREAFEGGLQSSFFHSYFSKSTLLFSLDETITEYYHDVKRVGGRDRAFQLLAKGCWLLGTLAKAEKWFYAKRDLPYSFLWILFCVEHLAAIETLLAGEVTGREVIHQALRHNPTFFQAVYLDLIAGPKDDAAIGDALDAVNGYIGEHAPVLFALILEYLREAGGTRTTTEIEAHFKKRAPIEGVCLACEWLAEKGTIAKVPVPLRLTEKSIATVDEAGYYYDAEPQP